jgi:hypothetical protein
MASRHARYAFTAVAVLAIGVFIEAFRAIVPGQTWPGYAPTLSRAVSVSLILLWTFTGASALLRRRHRFFASSAWTLAVLTPVSMVAHFALTRVGGAALGFIYVPLAAGLGFALKRTLDRGERLFMPTNVPGGRPPEANRAYRLMPPPGENPR